MEKPHTAHMPTQAEWNGPLLSDTDRIEMIQQVCDGKGSYGSYTDAGRLFTIATIAGAESGWQDGEDDPLAVWENEPPTAESFAEAQADAYDASR